ncbi:MAG: TolB family protein [Gemmatimonadota bacterium]
MIKLPHRAATIFVAALACQSAPPAESPSSRPEPPVASTVVAPVEGERHFSSIRQLTNGGENAEAYFSADGQWITFQSTRDGRACDQQYVMRADGSQLRRVSNGLGKTTCGWFLTGSSHLLFASSHAHDSACPPRPDASAGYVWPLDRFDLYTVGTDGRDLRRLTNFDVYTAESVISPDGRRIVFTSLKDGDLDIYTMNVDGTDLRRLTHTPGYDGGPWWSPDGTKIVYRAHHPRDSTELADYRRLLSLRMVRPRAVELFVMNADGSGQRQVTRLGGANFGPSWSPDGRRIIFSSNHQSPRSGNFDLFLVDAAASNAGPSQVEQVTFSPVFDGFPMFSPDGRRLIWASNRNALKPTDTNLFVADWRW